MSENMPKFTRFLFPTPMYACHLRRLLLQETPLTPDVFLGLSLEFLKFCVAVASRRLAILLSAVLWLMWSIRTEGQTP